VGTSKQECAHRQPGDLKDAALFEKYASQTDDGDPREEADGWISFSVMTKKPG
jgi:hypothetical protein